MPKVRRFAQIKVVKLDNFGRGQGFSMGKLASDPWMHGPAIE